MPLAVDLARARVRRLPTRPRPRADLSPWKLGGLTVAQLWRRLYVELWEDELWLYVSSAVILLGAEINSEIENAAARRGHPEAKAAGEIRPEEPAPRERAG